MAFLHINAFDYTDGWMKNCGSYTMGSVPQTTCTTALNTHNANSPALTFDVTLLQDSFGAQTPQAGSYVHQVGQGSQRPGGSGRVGGVKRGVDGWWVSEPLGLTFSAQQTAKMNAW